MSHSIYTAYAGMRSQAEALDVLSNNLANLQSSGFKQKRFYYELLDTLRDPALTQLGRAINAPRVQSHQVTDFSGGNLEQTGNPLDLALTGDGFFAVQTPEGVRYTRNGAFTLAEDGRLMTFDGFSVLVEGGPGGQGQPVQLPQGDVQVAAHGAIQVDGFEVGRLRVVAFQDDLALEAIGGTLFRAADGAAPVPPRDLSVAQGFLEQSNVSAVKSMTEMVALMRNFEMMSQTIRSLTRDVDQKLINEVGRI